MYIPFKDVHVLSTDKTSNRESHKQSGIPKVNHLHNAQILTNVLVCKTLTAACMHDIRMYSMAVTIMPSMPLPVYKFHCIDN